MKVRFTPQAEADLEDIGDNIAERNPRRAVTYVRELRARSGRIGDFPHAGPPRPQWGKDVRIAVHRKYLIVYRVRDETVQILRVVHGARDVEKLFEDEPLPE